MSEQPPPQPHQQPPASQPQRKQPSRAGGIIGLVVVVVILGGLVVLGIISSRSSATNAEVGECVERTGDDSLSIVECSDPAAQYKVVGRKENLKQYGNVNVCDEFDESTDRYWEGEQGSEGFFLCLAPVKRP